MELVGELEMEGYNEIENVELTDTQLTYHVRAALNSALQGDMDQYNELVSIINHREQLGPEEVAKLVVCLNTLSESVSSLDNVQHRSLLDSIFGMSMWNYWSTDVIDALVKLVISLAASSGKYVKDCLDMLVGNFVPPLSFMPLLNQPHGIQRKGQVVECVHSAIEGIAKLVPLSPLILGQKVVQSMPYIYGKVPLIVTYVENMLKLDSGAMGDLIGRNMLLAIMDRLIELDVKLPWDDILQEECTKHIFGLELEDLEGGVGYGDENSWLERYFGGNLIAQQLDSLMVLTFKHLKFCKDSGRLSQVFYALLQSFRTTVLSAYQPKFAQFVMFYACSLDPEKCSRIFADTLFDIFKISIYPERRTAVAYLASFLARANFLPISLIAEYVESLVEWCSTYCSKQNGSINPNAHEEFYAGCQAMMYVLCFRMRSMLAIPRFRSQILKHIEDILMHPLSPLMVCSPSIVEEFLRLMIKTDNFEPRDMFETELSRAFGDIERPDTFFPFDPCLLMGPDRYIRPNFVYWSMVQSLYDNDDDDDDDDAGTSDEDGIDIWTAGTGMNIVSSDNGAALYEFDNEMSKMSITSKSTSGFGDMEMPWRLRPCAESL